MTIKQLIKHLQEFEKDFGNKQVFVFGGDCYCPITDVNDKEQCGKVICNLEFDPYYVDKVFPNPWKFRVE